jgi:hypothetical protein
MAERHPYISAAGNIVKAIHQLKSSLPGKIDAAAFKKLGIAPKNESYLINILKFLGAIGPDGSPTPEARRVFTQHDPAAFNAQFSEMVKKAYSDLFSLQGEKAWGLGPSALVTYFRQTDQTSSVVGARQAATFQALAALAGHGELPAARPAGTAGAKGGETKRGRKPAAETKPPGARGKPHSVRQGEGGRDFALAVRIEINLPVADDQATYDRIFRSIRENLLNA